MHCVLESRVKKIILLYYLKTSSIILKHRVYYVRYTTIFSEKNKILRNEVLRIFRAHEYIFPRTYYTLCVFIYLFSGIFYLFIEHTYTRITNNNKIYKY